MLQNDNVVDQVTELCIKAFRLSADLGSEQLARSLQSALIELAKITILNAGIRETQNKAAESDVPMGNA